MHLLLESNSVQEFLTRELDRRVKVNPRYSQRGFARNLGLSPGELSEILRNKRKLGLKAALKIARAMGFNPAETKHLLHLSQVEKSKDWNIETRLTAEPAPLTASAVDQDVFHLLSEWFYFAVLNLVDTADFRWNSVWIAKRLGLSRTQAKVAMERLLRVGLVKKENGRTRSANDVVLSASGVPSEAVRNYHRQLLKKAIDALDFQPVQERDISGIGFACDPRDIEAIRREISEFQDKLTSKYRKGKLSEVYHLEVAFFRLSEG
ncbi:MAG: TIGR02147 family protein, partial [Bdellovibrionota bacterium]